MKFLNKPHLSFLLLFALLLFAPFWLSDGMFLDGVFYSCIARNLSAGIGSYWEPCFSMVNDRIFHSHPPLQFWLLSWLYKVLGTSIYVERFFTCIIFLSTVWLIRLNASALSLNNQSKALAYFSILLWLITPVVFWGYRHAILDTTMTLFCLATSYFIIRIKAGQYVMDYFLAALFFILAVMTKGVAAFFLLFIPISLFLIYRQDRLRILTSYILVFLAVPIVFFVTIYSTIHPAQVYFDNYLSKQVFASLANENEVTVSHNASIIIKLVSELIVPIILALLLFFAHQLSPKKIKVPSKEAWLFLFIGLSAILPYIFSLKQHRMYLLPGIPFFVLAVVYFYQEYFELIYKKLESTYFHKLRKVNHVLAILLIPALVVGMLFPLRDKQILEDAYHLVNTVQPHSILSTSHEVAQRWEFSAYMNRLGYISLDPHKEHDLILVDSHLGLPPNCNEVGRSVRYVVCRVGK